MKLLSSKRLKTQGKNDIKITKFRMSQVQQSDNQATLSRKITLNLFDRTNKPLQISSKSTIKLSNKKIPMLSSRKLRDISNFLTVNTILKTKRQSFQFIKTILCQIQLSKLYKNHTAAELQEIMNQLYCLSQRINNQIYSYLQVEKCLMSLNQTVGNVSSKTLWYKTFLFSALILFQYCNYSLSLYYFDQALKAFYDRQKTQYDKNQRQDEIQMYKHICKIFLAKQKYQQARKFGFKFLRKCWMEQNRYEQIVAYDILGKIYMQLQNLVMTQYFHHRMSSGQSENQKILNLSKQHLKKQSVITANFLFYETINIFVDKDGQFNDILENYYRMKSIQFRDSSQQVNQARQVFIYTHHSPNRLLNNYHSLQRKMLQAKQSKEIHFIKPKDCNKLRKLTNQYSSLAHDLRHKFQLKTYTQIQIDEESA